MKVEEIVGANIAARREALGWSQAELGERIAPTIGKVWTRQTVSAAEKGGRAFTAGEITALAVTLETGIARLFNANLADERITLPSGNEIDRADMPVLGGASDATSVNLPEIAEAAAILADSNDLVVQLGHEAQERLDRMVSLSSIAIRYAKGLETLVLAGKKVDDISREIDNAGDNA